MLAPFMLALEPEAECVVVALKHDPGDDIRLFG